MQMRLGRLEKRHERGIPVSISSLRQPVVNEKLNTENFSPRGLRVLTLYARRRDEIVEITLETTKQERLARVVYCEKLSNGKYGIGLEIIGDPIDWAAEMKSAPSIDSRG